jgi:hypothetical protein
MCVQCRTPFQVKNNRADTAKYCSIPCRWDAARAVTPEERRDKSIEYKRRWRAANPEKMARERDTQRQRDRLIRAAWTVSEREEYNEHQNELYAVKAAAAKFLREIGAIKRGALTSNICAAALRYVREQGLLPNRSTP